MARARPHKSDTIIIAVLAVLVAALLVVVGFQYFKPTPVALEKADRLFVRTVSSNDHIRGSLEAPIHVIAFSDPECPYCKKWHESALPALELEFKDEIAIVYRYRLVESYSRSHREAKAMECASKLAGNDGFWDYTDVLFKATPSGDRLDPAQLYVFAKEIGLDEGTFALCLESDHAEDRIARDREEASIAGLRLSPTIIVMRRDGSEPIIIPGSSHAAVRAAVAFLRTSPQSTP